MIIHASLVEEMKSMFKHGRRRDRLRGECSSCHGRGRGGGGNLCILSVRVFSAEKNVPDTYRTTRGSRM